MVPPIQCIKDSISVLECLDVFRNAKVTAAPVYRATPEISHILEFYDVITVEDILSIFLFPSLPQRPPKPEDEPFNPLMETERLSHLSKYYCIDFWQFNLFRFF